MRFVPRRTLDKVRMPIQVAVGERVCQTRGHHHHEVAKVAGRLSCTAVRIASAAGKRETDGLVALVDARRRSIAVELAVRAEVWAGS